jgi:2-polyprenyl-6-methoxyphenol hydroxylase-like FAD-dependent oxidoreductase
MRDIVGDRCSAEKGSNRAPKVLVSGASIAEPALAYWLIKGGFEVIVVERAPAPRAGGQAVGVRGPALTVIREMGLLDEVRAMRTHLKGISLLDIDGKELSRTEARTMSAGRLNSGDIEILRDDLAGLLLMFSRPGAAYVYGETITALEQNDAGVVVTFENRASELFDIVIGADGLHSNMRHLVFGDEASLFWPLGVALAIFTTPNLLNLRHSGVHLKRLRPRPRVLAGRTAFRSDFSASGNCSSSIFASSASNEREWLNITPQSKHSVVRIFCPSSTWRIRRIINRWQPGQKTGERLFINPSRRSGARPANPASQQQSGANARDCLQQ